MGGRDLKESKEQTLAWTDKGEGRRMSFNGASTANGKRAGGKRTESGFYFGNQESKSFLSSPRTTKIETNHIRCSVDQSVCVAQRWTTG